MSLIDEQMIEGLALEVRGLKDAIAKLTDRMSEAAGLWEPATYAVQPELFHVKEVGKSKRDSRVTISNPADVYHLCKDMRKLTQEHLDVLCLNTKNVVTKRETVFIGSLNVSVFHPREIFAVAIKHRAASIIIAHNHPSSNPEPSNEDIRATRQLKQAGDLIQIDLLDHVVIGDGFASLKEMGYF